MRILYGVTGEGLGRAMRARTIGDHLEARGHEVLFAASGRRMRCWRATSTTSSALKVFACATGAGSCGAVIAAEARSGDHFVVYRTSSADSALLAALASVPARFLVYGRGAHATRPAKNIEICPFDEDGFLADMASARGVLAHGGHTALSEALALGKPALSFSLRHQGEQELNAAYPDALGLGVAARAPDALTIGAFVRRAERMAPRALLRARNDQACATLDKLLLEAG